MSDATPRKDLGKLFCDLVMKGGITSGIVYPKAIVGLASKYRLRSIGGASAGAIAAAGAAAAEYRRQTDPVDPGAGFARMAGLAEELGQPMPGTGRSGERGRSRLLGLFAPTRLSRPIFSVLLGMLNKPSLGSRLGYGLMSLLKAFPLALGLAVALLAVCIYPVILGMGRAAAAGGVEQVSAWVGGAAASIAIAASVLLALVGFALWQSLGLFARIMAAQDFGLCTGMREPGDQGPAALTEWLHDLFQDMAKKPKGEPLTFGDLRRVKFPETPGEDGIVLRVMTTCLTAGRPYTLPFADDRLYFDPAELRKRFPEEVVAWMEKHPWAPKGHEDADRDRFAHDGTRRLHPLPAPDDFPVVVAVRMSLSFPILLSAVPLYRFVSKQEAEGAGLVMERLCFTDGGVCSNLPVHLFDSPMPDWPTFAINLRDDLPPGSEFAKRVIAPCRGRNYHGERYKILEDGSAAATVSFLIAIMNTMQNWRDNLQRAASGFKERVVTVCHTAEEGGLNLDMPAASIKTLAGSGELAAKALLETFQPEPGTPPAADDWHYHRWVRIRLLLPLLKDFLKGLNTGVHAEACTPTVRDLLTSTPAVMRNSFELNRASQAVAWAMLEDLGEVARRIEAEGDGFARSAPRPSGQIRVTPTF